MPAPQHYRTELSNIETQHKALRIAQPRSIPDELEQIGKSFARIEQIKAETSAHLAIVQSQQQTSKSSGSLWRLVGLGKSSSKSLSEHDRKLMADYDAVNTQAIALQKLLEESRWEARAILNTSAENNRPESEQKRVNYHAYLKSAEWRTKAEAAKAAAGNRCQVCNKSRAQVQLDAHHRTYERLGNELPEDITVLCRDCHQLYEDGKIASRPKTTPRRKPPKSNKKRNSSAKGFCVRCRKSVKLNPQSPYCYTCFKSWNRYANLEYKEKYCHACGQDHDSTMAKPVCYSCYKKYKSSLKFSFNTNVMKS